MSKFLTGKELSQKVYDIIWEADRILTIVSPFIKLDDYFKKHFEKHTDNHKLQLTIVFGRNLSSPSKSLRKEDFDFFKQFKNISIIYCPPLHAKYYANDKGGLITSINFYDTCFESNIEYGVYYPGKLMDAFVGSAETEAFDYTEELIQKYPAVFIRRPVYEKTLLSKNYLESTTLYDATDKILNINKWNQETKRYRHEFADEVKAGEFMERPERPERVETITQNQKPKYIQHANQQQSGYCIRTGKQIPFNLKKPMCVEAYQSWAQYKNFDFQEKYCHKTGRPSNGKTTMRNPVLGS
jgi:hypothetical protein